MDSLKELVRALVDHREQKIRNGSRGNKTTELTRAATATTGVLLLYDCTCSDHRQAMKHNMIAPDVKIIGSATADIAIALVILIAWDNGPEIGLTLNAAIKPRVPKESQTAQFIWALILKHFSALVCQDVPSVFATGPGVSNEGNAA